MTDGFASIDEVLQRRKANAGSDWPSRGATNRLEPECWPILSPSFSIAPGARVFGIGSCFARNIELHLARLGFDVPNVRAIADHPDQFAEYGAETLNKYTPVSILEELSWTAAILDRDDVVCADDVAPLLLDLGGDRYIDLRTRINPGTGQTLESHVARRQLIHSLNRAAFDCDLAVVTLGLIETWWDTHTGKSIEFHPQLLRQPNRDRFAFRRLSFGEALDATQASIDLLRRDPARRILLTTSPVPLGKTFTSDDVIVANGFSKAMLRTVAGVVAERSAGVDYFPSYESVMLTKADHVWNDDLIHVDSSFIGKVIARVIESYVGADPAIAVYQRRLRFAECVAAADWLGAEALYDADEAGAVLSVEHQLDLAEYEISTGAPDRAIARLRGLSMGQAEVLDHVRRAHLWRRLGVIDAAASACDDAFAAIARNAVQTRSIIGRVRAMGWQAEALHLAQRAEATFATDPLVLHFLARVQREDGDLAAYDRLTRAALLHDPESDAHLAFSKELGSRGDPLAAATVLVAFDPDLQRADFFRRVVPLLTTAGEHERLIELLLHRIECGLDDAATREALARALGQLERFDEAVTHARKAAILAPERADLRKLERRLGASASAPVGH